MKTNEHEKSKNKVGTKIKKRIYYKGIKKKSVLHDALEKRNIIKCSQFYSHFSVQSVQLNNWYDYVKLLKVFLLICYFKY